MAFCELDPEVELPLDQHQEVDQHQKVIKRFEQSYIASSIVNVQHLDVKDREKSCMRSMLESILPNLFLCKTYIFTVFGY